MSDASTAAESAAALVTKTAPPLTVSLSMVAGIQVSEIVLWATLIYTLMMIGHKGYQIYVDVFSRRRKKS